MNVQHLASVPGQTTTPRGSGESAVESVKQSGPGQTEVLTGMLWNIYIQIDTHTHARARALTFDSWEVNAGMLMNSNTVADDPEGAFLKRT